MEQQFLEDCRRELINGYSKKHHPFRFFTLATIHEGAPRQRTVVLRKLLPNFNILFYTDTRSQKIENIQHNSSVSALFYHPKKMLQIKIEGVANILDSKEENDALLKNIPVNSRKDYITNLAPGTEIKNPDHVEYLEDQINFSAIHIVPKTIEVLQLKRPNHIRIQYTLDDDQWIGQFLVP